MEGDDKGPNYTSGVIKTVIIEAENHYDIVQHETFAPYYI